MKLLTYLFISIPIFTLQVNALQIGPYQYDLGPGIRSGPNSFGYTITNEIPFEYNDISSTGNGIFSNVDDGVQRLDIGFNFNFFGTDYSDLYVSSNGLITFERSVGSDASQNELFTIPQIATIAPFWTNMTFEGTDGQLYYETSGPLGFQTLTLHWHGGRLFGGVLDEPLDFQATLFETTNHIIFSYRDVTNPVPGRFTDRSTNQGIPLGGVRFQFPEIGIRSDGPVNGDSLEFISRARANTSVLIGEVPEPSAWILLLLGLTGISISKRFSL